MTQTTKSLELSIIGQQLEDTLDNHSRRMKVRLESPRLRAAPPKATSSFRKLGYAAQIPESRAAHRRFGNMGRHGVACKAEERPTGDASKSSAGTPAAQKNFRTGP